MKKSNNDGSSNKENEEKSQEASISRMSGPTSILDDNPNNKKGKQVKFRGADPECTNNGDRPNNEEAESKSQDNNNTRVSGFTSVLEKNSLTTNTWEISEQQQAAEKIRKSQETKVKNTLAQFNVTSNEVVEWTSKNFQQYQDFRVKSFIYMLQAKP